MTDTARPFPTALEILNRFYAAEQLYTASPPSERDFSGMAAHLAPDAKLYQSPDLPFGGVFVGHEGYQQWAKAFAPYFDKLAPQDFAVFDEKGGDGGRIVLSTTVLMKVKKTGKQIRQLMVQVVEVDRERELITEMRPLYWDVAAFNAALGV